MSASSEQSAMSSEEWMSVRDIEGGYSNVECRMSNSEVGGTINLPVGRQACLSAGADNG
jgi:hypothetical protein